MSLRRFARRTLLGVAFVATADAAVAQPGTAVPSPMPPAAAASPAAASPVAETSVPCPELCPPPVNCRPLACLPPRVMVVRVPVPDFGLRQVGWKTPGCGTPGCGTPAGVAAPTGVAQPTGATTTVYHTYTVPYLTYTWVPAVQQPVGFAQQPVGFAQPVAPAPAPAPAPAAQPIGFGGPVLTELEIMFARALLNRFLQPAVGPQTPPPAADPCDTKLRALQLQIAELDRRIEVLRKDTDDKFGKTVQAIVSDKKEVNDLFEAVKNLKPTDSTDKVIKDLQEAVKKIEAGRRSNQRTTPAPFPRLARPARNGRSGETRFFAVRGRTLSAGWAGWSGFRGGIQVTGFDVPIRGVRSNPDR